MKTQTKLTLKFLEDALQDFLQAKLRPLEPIVRCRLEQLAWQYSQPLAQQNSQLLEQSNAEVLALKIFIQHQRSGSEHQQKIRGVLRHMLRLSCQLIKQARESGRDLSTIQQIHVLLFFPGEKSPYAKRTVSLVNIGAFPSTRSSISLSMGIPIVKAASEDDIKVTKENTIIKGSATDGNVIAGSATDRNLTENSTAEGHTKRDTEIDRTPANVRSDTSTHSGLKHHDTPSPQPALSEPPSAETPSPDVACFWNRWNIIKAAVAGVVVTVSGIGTYALTRPCVVGTCDIISTAQTLNSESQRLLNTAATPGETITADEVVTAYENLVEANYQLGRIPFWSRYYDVAQALLSQYQEEADFVSQIVTAQRQAYEATLSAQEAPHPLPVWEDIRGQWQEAIAQLSSVPPDAGATPLATTKLSEYQQYLSDIDQHINQERAAQAKITEAREVAQIAEARESSASSAESWQLVYVTWQVVIDRLAEVPKETMAYAEAQQLNAIYSDRLAVSQERHRAEQQAQIAYTEAMTLAETALQHEQDGQLTQALVAWQNALSNIQQIAEETSYYDQAQPLLSSYEEEMSRTEEALGTLAKLETYRPLLNRACTDSSPVCSYILEPDGIQIFVADAYAEGLRQFLTAGITMEGEASQLSNESPQLLKMTSLLQAISTIGNDSEIAIELFDSENQLIAIYEPSEGGYIQANVDNTL